MGGIFKKYGLFAKTPSKALGTVTKRSAKVYGPRKLTEYTQQVIIHVIKMQVAQIPKARTVALATLVMKVMASLVLM